MFKSILSELKNHLPFTISGAVSGVVLTIFLVKLPDNITYNVFYTLHPLHVLISAMVTGSMYKLKNPSKVKLIPLLLVGYFGTILIATLSDSLIPYMGEKLLGLEHAHIHIGFIEKWYLVNPLAILGVFIAYKAPHTTFPHSLHVLLSTFASLFHMLMATSILTPAIYLSMIVILTLAVWTPCCLSDIVFPMLFVRNNKMQ